MFSIKFEQLVPVVKDKLSEFRFKHVMGVVDEACRLGKILGEDEQKLKMAALLHDVAKCETAMNLREIIINSMGQSELLQYDHELWHAPVGSFWAEQKFKINDQDILSAIKYHTTGRAGMTMFEKIIFSADYIEVGRSGQHVDQCRRIMENGTIDEAVLYIYKTTIAFLLAKNKKIHPDTIIGYNYLLSM